MAYTTYSGARSAVGGTTYSGYTGATSAGYTGTTSAARVIQAPTTFASTGAYTGAYTGATSLGATSYTSGAYTGATSLGATSYTSGSFGGTTYASPSTFAGATSLGTSSLGLGSVVGTSSLGTSSLGLGNVRYAGAPVVQSSVAQARPLTSTVSVAGARPAVSQARVISSGVSGGYTSMASTGGYTSMAAPTVFGSQRTVVSGATMGTRIVSGARPATVISGGVVYTQPSGFVGQTQAAYEVKHKDDGQLQNLKELNQICGLKGVPVNDALQTLKLNAVDGQLSREQFIQAYLTLLDQFQIQAPSDEVANAVFDLFDKDDNGVVDMMEIVSGASLLCAGEQEDKIHAIFDCFDENGDGSISMDEMFKFLTSVFKVVLTPHVKSTMANMGEDVGSAEDLASKTAMECFQAADLNHDGKLSVDEFKVWFFGSRNDPSYLFSPVRKCLA